MVVITSWAPVRAFEKAGDGGPQPRRHSPTEDGQGQVDHGRQAGEGKADDDRHHPADANLALGADVEQPGAKAQGHRQAGKDVGHRLDQAVAGTAQRTAAAACSPSPLSVSANGLAGS